MKTNLVFQAENLEILKRIKEKSVKFCYLDPPYNSNRVYYDLITKQKVFEDTWEWDDECERQFNAIKDEKLKSIIKEFEVIRGRHYNRRKMTYCLFLAVRLIEIRRVLKDDGFVAIQFSDDGLHNMIQLMNAVFGSFNYRNLIIWERSRNKTPTNNALPRVCDYILLYSKKSGNNCGVKINALYKPYNEQQLKRYKYEDENGIYALESKIDNMVPIPKGENDPFYYKAFGVVNRWKWKVEDMKRGLREGWIIPPVKPGSKPRYKLYLHNTKGMPISNLWTDIKLASGAKENFKFQTSKPIKLLERLIELTTQENDIVLDPFFGSGTTGKAAHNLKRYFIGIEENADNINNFVKLRLEDIPVKYLKP